MTITEIAAGVFRFSTYVPDGPPGGICFNQFLLIDEEPVLIHTGLPMHVAGLLDAVTRVIAPGRLRWITSNHASRPDELGGLDACFASAPRASVAHGEVACSMNLSEVAPDRRRAMADGEVLETGRFRLRWLATPHVPSPWEAGFWFEETEAILFTGDVFSQPGRCAPVTTGDVVAPAIAHDSRGGATALTPATAPTLRALADLRPTTLALMHGPTYNGDGSAALWDLASHFGGRFAAAATRPSTPPGAGGRTRDVQRTLNITAAG